MDNGGNSRFSWELKTTAIQPMLLCFRYVERCGGHAACRVPFICHGARRTKNDRHKLKIKPVAASKLLFGPPFCGWYEGRRDAIYQTISENIRKLLHSFWIMGEMKNEGANGSA
jgi:hypothetical protein